jgi:DNA repair exonuclease SbcCD ATPase subunit
MIITKLILRDYKRLRLAGIKDLTYTPNHGTNQILGTNGVGKSSLLLELSPLPANIKKNYGKDGYKEIHILLGKDTYVLINDGSVHSFKLNEEELNFNNLVTTQRNLVKEHFKITDDIHKVVTGIQRLSSMSANDRKKYLTNISKVDYTYAIKLFHKLRDRRRDVMGGIKILQTKLSTIETNIVDDEVLNKLKKDKEVLSTLNKQLYAQQKDVTLKEVDLSTFVKRVESGIKALSKLEKPDGNIDILKGTLIQIDSRISDILTELPKLTDLPSNAELQDITEKLEGYKEVNTFNIPLNKRNGVYSHVKEELDTLHTIGNNLTNTTIFKYTLTEYKNKKVLVEHSLSSLKEQVIELERVLHTQLEYEQSDDVTCPKCAHEFKIGYDKRLLNISKEKLESVYKKITTLEKEHKTISEDIEILTRHHEALEKLDTLLKHPHLAYFKDVLVNNVVDPGMYITTINQILDSLQRLDGATELYTSMEKLTAKQDTNREVLLSRKKELEKELSELYSKKQGVMTSISKIAKYTELEKQLVNNKEQLHLLLKQYRGYRKLKVEQLRQDYIQKVLEITENETTLIDRTLNNVNYYKREKESILKEIDGYLVIKTTLDETIKALSPDSGIIADSINGFLHGIVDNMNKLIRGIWSYRLEVLPCGVDNTDLDYLFKVKVEEDTVDDVSACSTGQKEIIDYVFKLVTMEYIGIGRYPVLDDEPFINLDPVHRDKALHLLQRLVDSGEIEQRFVISHMDGSYVSTADTTVYLGTDENFENKRLNIKR